MSRVALVTGGGRGIGLAIARRLLADGYRVAVTYRSSPPPEEPGMLAVACDVTDTEQVDAAFDQIEAELGNVEVLVSNAGITADMLVLRMSDDDFARVIDTNLAGAVLVMCYTIPELVLLAWLFNWRVPSTTAWVFLILGGLVACAYNLFTCDWLAEKVA